MLCPHCRTALDDAPDLAGQLVSCPHCGEQFGMAAPVPPPAPQIAARERQRAQSRPRRGAAALRAMGIATAVWCGLMLLTIGFLSFSGISQAEYLGNGWYESTSGTPVKWARMAAEQVASAVTLSLLCPTVPYAILMGVLAVVWVSKQD